MADCPELTEDGYPTQEALDRISNAAPREALELAERAWHWDGWATRDLPVHERIVLHAEPQDEFIRFATGGWSGNESIISALDANRMLTMRYWRLSSRGGLHIYELPKP